MKVQIITPSRIHVTLIDMNGALGRIDGGIGISLSNPNWVITIENGRSDGLELKLPDAVDRAMVQQIAMQVLEALGVGLDSDISISIKAFIPQHIGLGSKTQLSLALADGISRIIAVGKLPLLKDKLTSIVKRGGTSGIGSNAYFDGGIIIDGGHEFGPSKEKQFFTPSSASNALPGPLLFCENLPSEWRVVCAIPSLEKGAHDQAEVDIFKQRCPIPLNEVQELSHLILMRMMPAIKLGDFDGICWCINKIQELGFKKIELSLRGEEYLQIMREWKEAGAPCVGMSSFGPCIYALVQNQEQALEIQGYIDSIIMPTRGSSFIAKICNRGAQIKII